MANEPTEQQAAAPAPAQAAPVKPGVETVSEVPELQDFLKQNLTPVLVGVGLAVAVFLGWTAYKNYKKTAAETASSLLFNSESIDQLQRVVDQYPNTPAAPLAMLSVAARHYDEGQYELAQHMYAEFVQRYPGHDMQSVAELGQAQCLEAMGRYDEAIAALTKFLEAHPEHYLGPVATFAKARSLEQSGRLQDAKAVYEDYLLANPSNDWSARAQSSILFVDKQIRAAAAGQAQQPQGITLEPIKLQ